MPTNLLDDHRVPTDFAVYQRFNRAEDLRAVVAVLQKSNIIVRTSGEEAGEWREATIIGSPLQPKFWIEIPSIQFEKANYMLQEAAEESLSEEDLDAHPFADYSRKELEDVLLEETAWDAEAVVIARRLLLRQGYDVDLGEIRRQSQERVARAYEPRSGTRWVMIVFALYGGFYLRIDARAVSANQANAGNVVIAGTVGIEVEDGFLERDERVFGVPLATEQSHFLTGDGQNDDGAAGWSLCEGARTGE